MQEIKAPLPIPDKHPALFLGGSIEMGLAERWQDRIVGHVTRDTFGTAIKATFADVNGEPRELFKDPKTDNGIKKSACGLIRLEFENDHYVLYDHQTPEQEQQGLLKTVFLDGEILNFQTLEQIRTRLRNGGRP